MTTPNLKCSCCGCETWRTCDCGDVIDGEYHAAQLRTAAMKMGGYPNNDLMKIMLHASKCANVVLDAIEKLKNKLEHRD